MQQQLQRIDVKPNADTQRVRAVVETLANLRNPAETVAEVAHDARNMVTALGLYCDLLEEPGVLSAPFAHYGSELRLVASASRRLVEKLVALEIDRDGARDGNRSVAASVLLPAGAQAATGSQHLPVPALGKFPVQSATVPSALTVRASSPLSHSVPASTPASNPASTPASSPASSSSSAASLISSPAPSPASSPVSSPVLGKLSGNLSGRLPGELSNRQPISSAPRPSAVTGREWELAPALPLKNLASELMANRNLLSALAGPSIILTTAVDGGALPVRLTGEDLTRILINLVKNACEAMPDGGRIRIALGEQMTESGHALLLTVEDSGPGIQDEHLDMVFVSGYSAPAAGRAAQKPAKGSWPSTHRGLGLAITRSIIEASGGRIWASNSNPRGARFTIELPVAIA
jgi:hypothetical protein